METLGTEKTLLYPSVLEILNILSNSTTATNGTNGSLPRGIYTGFSTILPLKILYPTFIFIYFIYFLASIVILSVVISQLRKNSQVLLAKALDPYSYYCCTKRERKKFSTEEKHDPFFFISVIFMRPEFFIPFFIFFFTFGRVSSYSFDFSYLFAFNPVLTYFSYGIFYSVSVLAFFIYILQIALW